MKKTFSTHWKSSTQKRKQVKYLANSPLHIKHKLMSSKLSKELRKKYSRKSISIRKNDLVKIMKGDFKKKTGKINKVNRKKMKVIIEGIQRQKKDGTKVNVWFYPNNLEIQELDLNDSKRNKALQKSSKGEKNAP